MLYRSIALIVSLSVATRMSAQLTRPSEDTVGQGVGSLVTEAPEHSLPTLAESRTSLLAFHYQRTRELNVRVAQATEGRIDPQLALLTMLLTTGAGGTFGLLTDLTLALSDPSHHHRGYAIPGAVIGFGAGVWIVATSPRLRRPTH
jgi:hypothetical protein